MGNQRKVEVMASDKKIGRSGDELMTVGLDEQVVKKLLGRMSRDELIFSASTLPSASRIGIRSTPSGATFSRTICRA